MTRQPLKTELERERLLVRVWLWDALITGIFILTAVTTGSLTLIGEAVRAALLLLFNGYALWLLYRSIRGRLLRYQFGLARIENLVWMLLGFGFLAAALWVAAVVFSALSPGTATNGPQGPALALAAIVNALGLVINYLGFRAMKAVPRDRGRGPLDEQIAIRWAMLLASALVQVTLTVAAIAHDPVIAQAFDALGAVLLVLFMVWRGSSLLHRGMRVLVDAPPDETRIRDIRKAVYELLPENSVAGIRARRSGRDIHAEVLVLDHAFVSTHEVASYFEKIEKVLEKREPGIDICLSIVSPSWHEERSAADAARS